MFSFFNNRLSSANITQHPKTRHFMNDEMALTGWWQNVYGIAQRVHSLTEEGHKKSPAVIN
jgi:hypothetical protein